MLSYHVLRTTYYSPSLSVTLFLQLLPSHLHPRLTNSKNIAMQVAQPLSPVTAYPVVGNLEPSLPPKEFSSCSLAPELWYAAF